MTSDFYHRRLVFPSFDPHINRIKQYVLPETAFSSVLVRFVLLVACSWFGSHFECFLWSVTLRGGWKARFIYCKYPHWASDKPVKLCARQKIIVWNQTWVRIPALPLLCCVTWGRFLHPSEPQFLIWTVELIITLNSWGCGDVTWWSCLWRI